MKLSEFTLRDERDETIEQERLAALERAVNRTEVPYPGDRTVPGLFAEQASKTPDAAAVISDGLEMSYRELDWRSGRLARFLSECGLEPEGFVGVMLERSPTAIVAMLGAMKAGGAYLPINPDTPPDRIAYMLRDSRARILIAAGDQLELCQRMRLACPDLRHLLLVDRKELQPPDGVAEVAADSGPGTSDAVAIDCARPEVRLGINLSAQSADTQIDLSRPDTLAYVMYTSGTTGRPKGVMITHRCVLRLVLNSNYLRPGPHDRLAHAANVAFDASTFEIWGALLNGASVFLLTRDQLLDPSAFARLMKERRFNVLFLTTALFNRLAQLEARAFEPLDYLLFGGEAADARRVAEVVESGGGPRRLLHVYGPTEATTFATYHEVGEVKAGAVTVPIGAPLANTQVFVLDENLKLADKGELYIGGDGLARGYLNDPVLTAQKFIPHPLGVGQRLYRTGDLVRWREDGDIEFVGRIDDQVKVRGFRVEPGEIESRLEQHEQIKEAVVVARAGEDTERYLAAYFTAHGQVDVAALRSHLEETLPDYMIPSFLVRLDEMPLTPNGKVDRSALPDPGRPQPSEEGAGETPTLETEKALLDIWREVLGQPEIGVDDNFFEHGGHSINAVKLMHLIHKKIGFSLSFTIVFKAPTVRELTQCILDAAKFGAAEIDQPMVTMGDGRGGRAVFAFPPGTGDALSYSNLARLLEPYAFHAFNFIMHETRVKDYADLITGAEPEGPYVLFGYSGGGNLAFRTARELEERGKQVSDVVMLDSSRFLEKFSFPAEEPRRLAATFMEEEGVKGYLTSQVLRDKVFRTIQKYYEFFSDLRENDKINANVHVVTSENSQDDYYDEAGRLICSKSGWAQLTRGEFKKYQGRGDHSHMLHGRHIEANAAILREILGGGSQVGDGVVPE